MKLAAIFGLLMLGICAGPQRARAQYGPATTVQVNLDLRSRLAAQGASRTALYGSSLQLRSRLAPGLNFLYDGAQVNAPTLTGAGVRFNSFVTQEAALEKVWGTQRLQAGVVRLPFGLYNTEETYASGLIDYPLARVDYGLNSVSWGAPGLRYSGGSPALQIEAAGFGGQASGVWNNRNNVTGGALRLQTYTHGLILGVSRWQGTQSASVEANEAGPRVTRINGLDVRFTRPHLLIRGEYLFGTLGAENMHGWYVDTYYHLPKFHRWTLAARVEGFTASSGDAMSKQVTLGFRYTLDRSWVLAVNWRKNNGITYSPNWTPYASHGGDLFFQAYRKIHF